MARRSYNEYDADNWTTLNVYVAYEGSARFGPGARLYDWCVQDEIPGLWYVFPTAFEPDGIRFDLSFSDPNAAFAFKMWCL